MCMVDLHAAFYCLLVYALSLAIARCCCDDNVYLICEMRASYTLSDTSRLTTTSILDHGLACAFCGILHANTRASPLNTRPRTGLRILGDFLGRFIRLSSITNPRAISTAGRL